MLLDLLLWWPLSLVWFLLSNVLTYLLFPWLVLPGAPVDALVRICFWLVPAIPAALSGHVLSVVGLGWGGSLLLRLVIVYLTTRLFWSLVLPMVVPKVPFVEKLGMSPLSTRLGEWAVRVSFDEAALAAKVMEGGALATNAFELTGLGISGFEITLSPLAWWCGMGVAATGVSVRGAARDARSYNATLGNEIATADAAIRDTPRRFI